MIALLAFIAGGVLLIMKEQFYHQHQVGIFLLYVGGVLLLWTLVQYASIKRQVNKQFRRRGF